MNESTASIDLSADKTTKQVHFTQESWDTVSNWNSAMTMLERYMSNLQHPVVRAVYSLVDSLEIVCRFSRSTTLHQT
jgi:hypothetical protein